MYIDKRDRKRKVLAFQYDGDMQTNEGDMLAPEFVAQAFKDRALFYDKIVKFNLWCVEKSSMRVVNVGDYIVQLPDGHITAMSKNLFNSLYRKEKTTCY